MDLGMVSLERCAKTLKAAEQQDLGRIRELYPDYGQRARILTSAAKLLPEEGAEYEVSVATAHATVRLSEKVRSELAEFLHAEARDLALAPEVRIKTGQLYLIEVATGQRHLGILAENRRIPCYFPPEYEAVVAELVPGSIVEIEGRATLNDHGDVERFEEVYDARPVYIGPILLTRVIHGNRRFNLKERISVEVDFREGLWVHEYEPLGMHGFGTSRAESLMAFRTDFAACWDEIACEADKNLTPDARDLKEKLRKIVDKVEDLA